MYIAFTFYFDHNESSAKLQAILESGMLAYKVYCTKFCNPCKNKHV